MNAEPAIVRVRNLKKYFPVKSKGLFAPKRVLKAVDDVSFSIGRGETFGLVGESGCGKSTVARAVLRLYDVDGGSIEFEGADLAKLTQAQLLPYRKDIQMIFQDPFASLDPTMTVQMIVEEPMRVHMKLSDKERKQLVIDALARVGLSRNLLNRYPHEFSGGQRQRIGIARALVCSPKLVLCDEPISALDASIQAQVVNMLQDLQQANGWSYLFIAHDLAMVKYISTHMGVMYLGRMVEMAASAEIYARPLHPYTQGLLRAIPQPNPRAARERVRASMEGEIPSPLDPPSGCPFHTRCAQCKAICSEQAPEMKDLGGSHFVACHLY